MQKELTLFEKVKEAIRLSDKVGRSRGSNCYALDKQAVDKLVVLEIGLEAQIKTELDAKDAEIATLTAITTALQDTNSQLRLDVAEAWAARESMREEKDAEIAALKKQVWMYEMCSNTHACAELHRNAGRYQLLRRGQHWSVVDGIGDTLRAEVLDVAIDKAIAQAVQA